MEGVKEFSVKPTPSIDDLFARIKRADIMSFYRHDLSNFEHIVVPTGRGYMLMQKDIIFPEEAELIKMGKYH